MVSSMLMAGEVSEQKALEIAQRFMQDKSFVQKSLHRAQAQGIEEFYVFNADHNGGFVIVSADDRTLPVLGYADEGSLDMDNLPENVRRWLEDYALGIRELGDAGASPSLRRVYGGVVEPLLTSKWNQSKPFNNQCPKDNDGNLSVTGCVATAMAQVMYYYQWPQNAVEPLPSYVTSSNSINVPALEATTFKWDKMRDTYTQSDTDEGAEAVAELMRYCGQLIKMDYTSASSGGSVNASHMINYFGYSTTARDVSRSDYTTADWEKMVYEEVANHRPVLYSGFSDTGGHEFVIDGYDDNGLFHVNWGWGGAYDGYFVLSILNPSGRGIGGGVSENGYASNQDALIGLKKPEAGDPAVIPSVFLYPLYNEDNPVVTRPKTTVNFNVTLSGYISFWGEGNANIDYQWVVCKNGEVLDVLNTQTDIEVTPGYFSSVSASVLMGKTLENGTYEIKGMYRRSGEGDWLMCGKYGNILLAEINDKQLTFKYASQIEDAVVVNAVNVTGDKKEGRPMCAKVNWTNNGYETGQTFYVWLSNPATSDYTAYNTGYLDNGQTGDVDIAFIPNMVGERTLTIATDKEAKNIVYTEDLTIQESLTHNLKVSVVIEGKSGYQLESNAFTASATIKNQGTNDYDDNIIFELTPIDMNGYSYTIDGEPIDLLKPLTLAVGAQKTLTAGFGGLLTNQWYMLDVYYYTKTANGYVRWAADDYCITGTATAIRHTEADRQTVEGYYTLDGKRVDKPGKGVVIVRMKDGQTRKVVVR